MLEAGLAEPGEVVVEGFEPGYLDSIGMGYDALSAQSPSLVFT